MRNVCGVQQLTNMVLKQSVPSVGSCVVVLGMVGPSGFGENCAPERGTWFENAEKPAQAAGQNELHEFVDL